MTGLLSSRFCGSFVTVAFVWRIFATCVVVFTTVVLLGDRATMVRLSRDSMTRVPSVTQGSYGVNYVKQKVGVVTPVNTKVKPKFNPGTPVNINDSLKVDQATQVTLNDKPTVDPVTLVSIKDKPKVGPTTPVNINDKPKVDPATWADIKINSTIPDSNIEHGIRDIKTVKRKYPTGVKLHPIYHNKSKQENVVIVEAKPKPRLWTDEESLQLFNISITLEEKNVFKELLKAFAKVAQENKLDYFLCCGSLLGSYRHHGMIPWDDDIDVMMNSSHKKAIKSAFKFPTMLTLDTRIRFRWKVYFNSSNLIKGRPWKWPFLDLILFTENSSHIWEIDPQLSKHRFQKLSVFPTVSRPFWDLWLPAPRDTKRVLMDEFGVDVCASPTWNHKLEIKQNNRMYRRVPCRSLYGRVPLVSRQILNKTAIIETLFLGNRTLSAVVIRKP